MLNNKAILLLDEPSLFESTYGSYADIFCLELNALGTSLRFQIGIFQEKALLADIVPLARKISTKLALAALDELRKTGESVPCRKGCSACCSFLVPLSVPEAFRSRDEILQLPEAKKAPLLKKYLSASKKVISQSSRIAKNFEQQQIENDSLLENLSRWYAHLNLPCPFLSDSLCTMYDERPTACREYIVIGEKSLCDEPDKSKLNSVELPISMTNCLGQLASELEERPVEAIMLPLALPWVQNNLDRYNKTWPTRLMVERFAEIIKSKQLKFQTCLSL